MPRDFIPRPDAAFASFAKNFCDNILADPEVYGVSPDTAAECAAKRVIFAQYYARAQDPLTRTASAVAGKNAARADSERAIRWVAGTVRAYSTNTPEMRIALGMNERNGGGKSRRIATPDSVPAVSVTRVMGQTVTIRLSDPTSLRRGKPRGIGAAMIYAAIGEPASQYSHEWLRVGMVSRVEAEVTIPRGPLPPGTKLWVRAQWLSPRGQGGPLGRPTSTYTNGELGPPAMNLLAA